MAAGHDCVTIDGGGVPRAWPFMEGGQEIMAPIRSKLTVSTSEAAVEAAILGSGLTRVMSYKMEAARLSGALVLVLEDFEKEPLPVHILFKERRPMPLKQRVFLDWLIPRLKVRLAPQAASIRAAGAKSAIGAVRSSGRARGRRTGL
jgi:DNA-binding transcriptional LysR family regulator